MRRALLIVNPKASQAADRFGEIAGHLESGGLTVESGRAESEEGYEACLKKWRDRLDLLVVAGGDGTVRCAAEAVHAATGGQLPIGIIALGTANNVARSLGLPLSVQKACAVIAEGNQSAMDLARVNRRIFVSVVGMGLSTQVHRQVPSEQKKRWGWLSYAAQAIKVLLHRPPMFRVKVRHDAGVFEARALQLTVCNGRFYGAHLEIHPAASLHDGLLDLSVVEGGNYVRGFFKTLLPLAAGHASPGLRLVRSRQFEVTTRPVLKIDVEGATDLATPARFDVLPGAIQVFTPGR